MAALLASVLRGASTTHALTFRTETVRVLDAAALLLPRHPDDTRGNAVNAEGYQSTTP
jgi:hypothetical protein